MSKTASDIIATGYAPANVPEAQSDIEQADANGASSRGILSAAIQIYEAAGLLRQVPGITAHDISQIIAPAILAVQRSVDYQIKRRQTAAIEKPAPSIIQNGPDKAADFLRAVNGGANVQVADSKAINAQIDRENVSQR